MPNPTTKSQQTPQQRVEKPKLRELQHYAPAMDVLEKGEGYTLYFDVPGTKAGAVDITYDDDVLTIEAAVASRQADDQRYVAREYGVGPFRRSLRMGTPINPDGIKAELKNGELILNVPKAESARTRKVQVKTA